MTLGKRLLLNLYYHGTLPARAMRGALRNRRGKAPVMVLFYHRIADDLPTPWTATNREFRQHLDWLARHFDLVSLEEAQRRVRSGDNHRPSVTITFDDGYADNCQQALPLLIERQIPCTYFVSTRFVLGNRPFPHDTALGYQLAPNTPEQIRAMSDAGIDIGCHTRSHADVGQITDPAELEDELLVARYELEEITGRPVRYFAFPFGQKVNLNPAAFRLAREAGYAGVCSAYGGANFPGDDAFHMQRIHADNELLRLKNWVTLDPRKLRATTRYEYRNDFAAPRVELAGAST